MSRIGNKSISFSEKVKVTVSGFDVVVEGPKGKLEWSMPLGISAKVDGTELVVERADESRQLRALHGTARSLINNMVVGVTEGFKKDLEIIGVGFRAAVKGSNLDLSLGKSHPIIHPIPAGLTVKVEKNTSVSVEGIDKQMVGQFAAEVRSYYPPEPYKGKGVRYVGEYVRRKAGKSVGK